MERSYFERAYGKAEAAGLVLSQIMLGKHGNIDLKNDLKDCPAVYSWKILKHPKFKDYCYRGNALNSCNSVQEMHYESMNQILC